MTFANGLFKIFLLLLLFSHAINGVFSLNCYLCESLENGECDKDEINPIYSSRCENEYDAYSYDTYARALTSEPLFLPIIRNMSLVDALKPDFVRQEGIEKSKSIWDCVKFVGTTKGKKYILRTCVLQEISCSDYVSELKKNSYEVSKCLRCGEGECNSSSELHTSLWLVVLFTSNLLLVKFLSNS